MGSLHLATAQTNKNNNTFICDVILKFWQCSSVCKTGLKNLCVPGSFWVGEQLSVNRFPYVLSLFPITVSAGIIQHWGKKNRKKMSKTMEESNCSLSNCQQCLLWACICPELQLCLQFWEWHNWRSGGETSIVFCGEEGNRFQGQNPPK